MTEHQHLYIYPPPDGPTSLGICACGSTSEGQNVADVDQRLSYTDNREQGYAWRQWALINKERIHQLRDKEE